MSFFGVQILNFIFFLVFRKMINFWGRKTLRVYLFGVITKIGLYLEVISMHLRVFSEGQDTEWGIFFEVAKISNIFGGGGGGGER